MKKDLIINKKFNIILLIAAIFFWLTAFYLCSGEEGSSPDMVFVMAPWLGMWFNSYLILRITKIQHDFLTNFSLMLFISTISALKLIAAFRAADFYQEHFRAFRPDISITLNCYSILIMALLELFLIMFILLLYSSKPFRFKTYILFGLLIFTLGDLFWWFLSGLIWLIFHMGGIAG